MTALKKQHKEELKSKYLNRELSWLKFNDRVLLEAQNTEIPGVLTDLIVDREWQILPRINARGNFTRDFAWIHGGR